ncbi:tetratricopeptide repeat protein [Nocardia sp. NPDC004722]
MTGKKDAVAHDKIAKARALIALRRYRDARELLAEVLAADPDNATALADMGKVALMLGDGERALEFTAAALRLAPESAYIWRVRVYAALRTTLGERDPALRRAATDLALEAARRAVELDPLASESFRVLAAAQRGDDPRAALASIDRAVEIDPENVVAHQMRADILGEDLDRREESEAALRTVLRLDPENAAARFDLALLDLARGDREAAVRGLRGIGATDPRWGNTVRAQLRLIALQDRLDALARRNPAAVRLVRRYPRLADFLAHLLPG